MPQRVYTRETAQKIDFFLHENCEEVTRNLEAIETKENQISSTRRTENKMKKKKKKKKKKREKERRKKGNEASKGVHPETAQKIVFFENKRYN